MGKLGDDDTPQKQLRFAAEVRTMTERWGSQLRHDPAYSPNLTLSFEDCSLAGNGESVSERTVE